MKTWMGLIICWVLAGLVSPSLAADPVILEAQKILAGRGFYHGDVDGISGSQTAAAIRRYQLAENLRVTGQLNPQTARSLGLSSPLPDSAPRLGSVPTAMVEAARAKLGTMGYSIHTDQKFVNAIRAWQKSSDLPVTGHLDAATLKGLGLTP